MTAAPSGAPRGAPAFAHGVRLFAEPGAVLGEGPVWDAAQDALLTLDCVGRRMFRHASAGRQTADWALPKAPGSFALRRAARGMLMAYRNGLALIDPESGEQQDIDAAPADFARERFNDGCCDRRGRFWTGTMDRALKDPVGALYRIDADRSVHRMAGGITLSNGIAFSPDDRLLYHCDSGPALVRVFDFDLGDGTIANPRVHIDFAGLGGRPDGCAMDVEGHLWVAAVEAGAVLRFDPHGRLVRHVTMPVSRPTSLAFGGADHATLFVTSMREGPMAEESHAGAIFAFEPGVAGLLVPPFAG